MPTISEREKALRDALDGLCDVCKNLFTICDDLNNLQDYRLTSTSQALENAERAIKKLRNRFPDEPLEGERELWPSPGYTDMSRMRVASPKPTPTPDGTSDVGRVPDVDGTAVAANEKLYGSMRICTPHCSLRGDACSICR